ncbi:MULTISPECIES: molecular chaperone DnaK [Oceanotoga]|jgi:molecular chaperone DnaK|uniref:Chaperone protein DnaK n=1 Tax=Oceanotoga teriensis TaxID=515440 RepID=A0AA45HJT6_9BACT|nr:MULTISPECIES: molecular chaperone DnaK [Oceanotoga]MDN5343214.1 molecular chaperone DnaK [Oceanotoga sp.]MDO7975412.1 molecular chaperone DnaK [Oceanotoga teriensis]PWJ96300.1 molecular chaperone DnaK [Oceanotoga teriensis]
MSQKEYVVGIDLGTTNSAISWMKPDGNVEILPNSEGKRTTPSIVSFTKDGEIIVGEPAKRQAVLNSDKTVRSIKRYMGTDHIVKIDDKSYSPQQISAFILKKLVKDAEDYLNGKITKAVITVPAYFNDSQRQATKEAGEIAGLEVLRIINEPTAASIAFGLDKSNSGDKKIVVYDLGGGTFDVSILEIGDDIIEVISTSGNNKLGGDDFDQKLIDFLAEEFKKEHNVDLREDKQAIQRLKEAAEGAKIELSSKLETEINLPFITVANGQPLHLEKKITRSKFEDLVGDLIQATRIPMENALKDSGLSVNEIDEVLLVGGSTRMPAVSKLVKEFFGKEPNKGVNPDEAVSLGAAVQGAVMTGNTDKDIVLVDVTPLSLGVEVKGGLVQNIIPRNSKIPIKKSQTFTTAVDFQPEVEVRIFQGERTLAKDNALLGSFKLTGIAPAPRGVPQIEVTFDIDSNGIVNVSAKDLGTNKEQSMVVTGRQKLNSDEIQKMIKDAQEYEEQDKRKREEIELKNQAEDLAYQMEKLLNENKDKISEDVKSNLELKIKDLRDALAEDNIGKIKILVDEIKQESMKIGQQIYGQNGQNGQGPQDPQGPNDYQDPQQPQQ